MAKKYDVNGSNNPADPLNSSNSSGFFGMVDDFIGEMLFGDANASSHIANELTGYNKQQREFAQQEYLIEQYETPQAKMANMRAAGINPLTAASGIAGSGTSVPQVSSPGDTAAGALNAASGLVGTAAQSALARSQSAATDSKLPHEIDKIDSDTYTNLMRGGLDKWSAKAIETTLPLTTDNMRADYYQKLATIDKTWQEYDNLKAQHDNIVAEYDLIIQNKDTLYSQQQVNEAIKAKTSEETRWIKQDNDFWENHGYRRDDAVHQAIMHIKSNGGDPSFIGDELSAYEGRVAKAVETEKANASWLKLPSSPTEAAYVVVNDVANQPWLQKYFKDGVAKLQDLKSDSESYRAFKEAYRDAKHDLYNTYRKAKARYNECKHSAMSDAEIARLKIAKDDAYDAYDSFTEEKFSDELVKNLSPR